MRFNTILIIVCIFLTISADAEERERTRYWKERYQVFELELDSVPRGEIVFLGNSITEGFDLKTFFPDKKLVNRGIIGDHIDGLLDRLNNSAVVLQPRKIFLMIGINDIGDRRDDEYLKAMYSTLFDTLQHLLPDTRIYLHSILPTSPRWNNCPPEQIIRLNQWLLTEAIDRKFVYVNLHSDFVNNVGYINPGLTNDGLHPNQKGYAVWAAAILQFLD